MNSGWVYLSRDQQMEVLEMSREQVFKELLENRLRSEAQRRDAEYGDSSWALEELRDAWQAAQRQAAAAYDHWRDVPDAMAYATYRAAQDRADAAQEALWQRHILESAINANERRAA
jgi:hypothetical protein